LDLISDILLDLWSLLWTLDHQPPTTSLGTVTVHVQKATIRIAHKTIQLSNVKTNLRLQSHSRIERDQSYYPLQIMGNTSSTPDGTPATTPKPEIVNDIFTALQTTLQEKISQHSLSDAEQQLLMMALRTKLQQVSPSAMGSPTIASDILECIGQTKLVKINNTEKEGRLGEVVAMLEYTNPYLSVKDRIVMQMFKDAEEKGEITPGVTTIVDITSGNTGENFLMMML
jgi:hypothetical protein